MVRRFTNAICTHLIYYYPQPLRRFKVLQISFDYRKSSVLRRHACIPSLLNINSPKVERVWTWWPSVFTSLADKRKHGITCLLIFRTYYRYVKCFPPLFFWIFSPPFFKGQRFRTWPYISPTRPNPQSTIASRRSLPLHFSILRPPRIRRWNT